MVRKRQRFVRRALQGWIAACGAASAAAVVLLVGLPLDMPTSLAPLATPTAPTQPSSKMLEPLRDYALIYERNLRKALFDLPVLTPAKPDQPKPQLTIRLLGVVAEPGFARALFRTKSGEEKLIAPGQTIDGAELLEVADGSVTVRFAGDSLTLKVQKEEGRP